MWGSRTTVKTLPVASGVSLTLVEEKHFRWKIKNFHGIKNSPDRNLVKQQSFTFTAGESVGQHTKWECYLREKPETKVITMYLALQSQTDPDQKDVCVSYEFKKIKSNGKVDNVATSTYRWFSLPRNDYSWGFESFNFKDEDSLTDLIWKDGSIVIEVGFKLYAMQCKKMDLIEQVKIFEKKEVQNLSVAMTNMLLENKGQVDEDDRGTVKLVAKDHTEFSVNSAILIARSPVFRAMFAAGNWKEGQHCGGSLVLEDLSGKTLNVLLHYLYGGVLLEEEWKAEDVIVELTWAAQKYQLDGLSEFLDKVLAKLPIESKEVMGKLALLAKRMGMKNAEKELLNKLKKEAVDIDELVLDKEGDLLGHVKGKGQRLFCGIM